VSDYPSIQELADYLNYLMKNETAYEEHRNWRLNYTLEENVKNKPLMDRSWQCRVCDWAANQYYLLLENEQLQQAVGLEEDTVSNYNKTGLPLSKISNRECMVKSEVKSKLSKDYESRLLRPSNQKGIYLVKDGILRLVPDFDTFVALKFDLSNVRVIEPIEFDRMIVGDTLPRVIG
jgi:hypothetical protein